MTSLSDQFTTLKAAIAIAEHELTALNGGKKSSAPRFRKSLQNIKLQSQLIRKSTTLHVKALPTKKRPIKITPEPVEPLECLTQPVEPVECLTQPVEPAPPQVEESKPKKKRTNKNKKV